VVLVCHPELVEESLDAIKNRKLNTAALTGLIGRGAMGWDGLLADTRYGDARGRLEGLA
jgi:beta-N-acetylhexosaminidase